MNAVLQLKIIGYYGHSNTGDEQYKISFIEMFKKYMPEGRVYETMFYDCDKIHDVNFSEDDIIILGGGDVLNDYFLDKIYDKFNNRQNKILAVSVGLPFVSELFTNKLNIIDYIFIRTLQDIELFKKYFDSSCIYYLPDISFFLKDIDTEIQSTKTAFAVNKNVAITADTIETYIQTLRDNGKKVACVSFTRHIYNKRYEAEYHQVLGKLCKFVDYIDNMGYHVIFLPFNDNINNATEDDTIIHKEILNKINNKDVTFINSTISYKTVFSILKHIDIYIMSRFHACLFSIYNNVPLLPIYSTRKIENLLLDINWQYAYKMDTNEKGVPIDIDLEKLKDVFMKLQGDAFKISKLNYINENIFEKNLSQGASQCIDVIIKDYTKTKKCNIIDDLYKDVKAYINSKGICELGDIRDEKMKKMVVNIVEYKLIGCINSIYNWGLLTKMFVGDYRTVFNT